MSSSDFVSIDWRNAPSTSEIIDLIIKFFSDLDERGEVSMCLSNSTAKSAVCLLEQDGVETIRRRNNTVSVSQ